MIAYALRRLLATFPLVLLVAFVTFALVHVMPGDPAASIAGDFATPEQIARIREQLGLDDHVLAQFWRWIGDVVRGDLGQSLALRADVTTLLSQRWAVTVSIVVIGLLFSILIGIPAGVAAGINPGSVADRVITVVTTLGLAIPAYWLAMLLIGTFAIRLDWFDATGFHSLSEGAWPWFRSLILPGLAVASTSGADIARQTRASVANVVGRDHIRTARAMGLFPRSIVFRHVLRSGGVSILTVTSLQVERLIGSAVVVELLFAMPGIGTLALNAVLAQDIPIIQGVVLVIATVVILVNLLTDVAYGWIDPQLRRR